MMMIVMMVTYIVILILIERKKNVKMIIKRLANPTPREPTAAILPPKNLSSLIGKRNDMKEAMQLKWH